MANGKALASDKKFLGCIPLERGLQVASILFAAFNFIKFAFQDYYTSNLIESIIVGISSLVFLFGTCKKEIVSIGQYFVVMFMDTGYYIYKFIKNAVDYSNSDETERDLSISDMAKLYGAPEYAVKAVDAYEKAYAAQGKEFTLHDAANVAKDLGIEQEEIDEIKIVSNEAPAPQPTTSSHSISKMAKMYGVPEDIVKAIEAYEDAYAAEGKEFTLHDAADIAEEKGADPSLVAK
ncbi:hypothetical protein BCR32DRAFT_242643, partial [Anaeromyces robustus]